MLTKEKTISNEPFSQRIAQKQSKSCTVLAIASGKGGVGKTSIATNMAICLAQEGHNVMLFDADMGLANVDVVMNVHCRYNLIHLLSGTKTMDEIIGIGHCGVEVICGSSGIESLADLNEFDRERIICELDKISENKDIIIIDNGAGIQKNVIGFCMAAQSVMVVTTPEPTAITDAYATIKVLVFKNYSGRINLVVNMAESLSEGKKVYRQIAAVTMRFLNTAIFDGGTILKDSMFCESIKSRKPLVIGYPNSKAAKSIILMAERLTKDSEQQQIEKNSFFRKVVNKFF